MASCNILAGPICVLAIFQNELVAENRQKFCKNVGIYFI